MVRLGREQRVSQIFGSCGLLKPSRAGGYICGGSPKLGWDMLGNHGPACPLAMWWQALGRAGSFNFQ